MMLDRLAMQTIGGMPPEILPAVLVVCAMVISVSLLTVIYLRRRPEPGAPARGGEVPSGPGSAAILRDMSRMDDELRSTRERIDALSSSMPHAGEIDDVKKGMDGLCADFGRLSADLNGRMEAFRRATAEDVDRMRLAMEKAALEKIVAKASTLLDENGVPRAEFDALRERFDRMHGADESEERMAVLSRLFAPSTTIRVLNWQCKLIRLLRGGLAPDAEQDLIASEGIPESAFRKFLQRLVDHGIAESRSVRAYYLEDEYEWVHAYTDRPDWLYRRLQGTGKKEADYQRHVRTNAGLIEEGLIVEGEEYQLDSGRLDLVCRDAAGRAVGIELKYPAAAVRDKRQIASYRDDYRRKSGMPDSRFMLVAPRIPDELKRQLDRDGIEYREVPMDAGGGAVPAGSPAPPGGGAAPVNP